MSEDKDWRRLETLLDAYWNLAFSEGRDGVSRGDKANAVLHAIRAAWNLRQQVPNGWREFIENIATVGSEPLNSAVVYRALASRRRFMAELRNKARALLAEAPKPEDAK